MALYGLIGEKLGHSFSKIIHEKMGYSYDLVELKKEEVESFVKSKKYKGFNVTIPYKQVVMPFLDVIDESAKLIGSVNTVINKDGKLIGYNTDIFGMEYAFKQAGIVVENKKVIILGSGGTYATAYALCKKQKAKQIINVSRSGENNYSNLDKHFDAQVIINTTPVGMYPNNYNCLVNLKDFTKLEGVFDAIYNPLKTQLLLQCEEKFTAKSGYCNGLKMLVAQAKYARDIFFGNQADFNIIEKIVSEIESDKQNIVLIGMPASGKSSIGKIVASALNKEFIDTDQKIIEKAGCSIPEIFDKQGEKAFRQIEKQVALEVAITQGKVIATGGGIILDKENIDALKQNGICVFLDRDIELLTGEGRPLSSSKEAIQKLYDSRIHLYNKYADIKVMSNDSVNKVAQDILEKIKLN